MFGKLFTRKLLDEADKRELDRRKKLAQLEFLRKAEHKAMIWEESADIQAKLGMIPETMAQVARAKKRLLHDLAESIAADINAMDRA